jgi:hypothetical protein
MSDCDESNATEIVTSRYIAAYLAALSGARAAGNDVATCDNMARKSADRALIAFDEFDKALAAELRD